MVWLRRVVLSLAALGILYAGYNYYQNAYYGDHIPGRAEVVAFLVKAWHRLTFERLLQILHSERFHQRLPYRIRLLIFVTIIWSVYFAAGAILIYESLRKIYTDLRPLGGRSKLYRPVRAGILGLAFLGTLSILYGFYVEPYWLEVTRLRIATSKMAKETGPIRVVLFSDLHCARKARLEGRLPGVIAREKPDVILFGGDALNSSQAVGRFKELMAKLAKIAPTFAVEGNWDKEYWSDKDIYGKTGVHQLSAEAVSIKARGAEIWISGSGHSDPEGRIRVLSEAPPGIFSVYLHHDPSHMEEVKQRGVDLYLCGHTHGGQIALPFYGALVTYATFDKKYEAGLYQEGNTRMYVNRGIGLARWPQPEARFWARPEVTVIDIVPAPR